MSEWFWLWLVRRLRPALAYAQRNGQLFDPGDLIFPRVLAPSPPTPAELAATHAPATEHELRRLMGLALTTPTPDAIMHFVQFASRLKRLGAYNIMMVFTQRPGASAVASREEWLAAGQTVRPDAIPILILHPKGPIRPVFELVDTLPRQDRDPRVDPFGAIGSFDAARLERLIRVLARPTKRRLTVEVTCEDFGGDLAGRITGFAQPSLAQADLLGASDPATAIQSGGPARWRIKLNRRLTPPEQFATLLHELGHLFCGHLGGFDMDNSAADEYGWPDRRGLPHATREIEAELVAWHICEREGLTTGSPLYLNGYMVQAGADVARVDLDRVIRAIARVRAYLGDPKTGAA